MEMSVETLAMMVVVSLLLFTGSIILPILPQEQKQDENENVSFYFCFVLVYFFVRTGEKKWNCKMLKFHFEESGVGCELV